MQREFEAGEQQLAKHETDTERLILQFEQIEHALEALDTAVSALESEDAQVAAVIQKNLQQKVEEKQQLDGKIDRLLRKLEELQRRIDGIKDEHDQSIQDVAGLRQVGEDVTDTIAVLEQRGEAIDDQTKRCQALIQRLQGERNVETQAYSPRARPPVSEQTRWVDDGIVPVNVNSLDAPQGIGGAADFRKVPMEIMKTGILRLKEMEPAINSGYGASSDYWADFDRTKGLDYEHGYQRVYDAFFGSDAIKVTFDGQHFDIVNGRHRVWLAQQLGIDKLPMRVSRKIDLTDTN